MDEYDVNLHGENDDGVEGMGYEDEDNMQSKFK